MEGFAGRAAEPALLHQALQPALSGPVGGGLQAAGASRGPAWP